MTSSIAGQVMVQNGDRTPCLRAVTAHITTFMEVGSTDCAASTSIAALRVCCGLLAEPALACVRRCLQTCARRFSSRSYTTSRSFDAVSSLRNGSGGGTR